LRRFTSQSVNLATSGAGKFSMALSISSTVLIGNIITAPMTSGKPAGMAVR
jgi:hypothetical protein